MPHITVLCFSGASLCVRACGALAKCSLRYKKTLLALDFCDVFSARLTSEIAPALDAFVPAFLKLPSLELIRLSKNAFGLTREINLLVRKGPVELPHLNILYLEDNTIGSEGQTHMALADAVACWPKLEISDLNDSLLCAKGAALLIVALKASCG
ncbi:hypothetical protein M406DRAFT_332277 [Cryphonectria parasitica EP155]|uniref:Uncharacterized protein n=1 Tax=Cryphonectria parasitica (strain ATCC 38755 / EP155) TaxID=660469 RepID=A0A9P4XZW4_CRYP1|nr:uncharacterized protein M406DRAFT_332277 [Cryphonectria parasitica EP155]KAF3763827.1 hypothetical protein M406DRAFT_332277 [Cryphonectria parasitica EP155]